MKYILLSLLFVNSIQSSQEIIPSRPHYPPILTRSPEMQFNHHRSITITVDEKDSPGKKPFCSEKTKKILVSSAVVVVTAGISALVTFYAKQCGN